MRLRKLLIRVLLSTVALGGIASAAYLHSVVEQYKDAAPCGELKGVPALLQKAHLIGFGTCTLSSGGCNVGAACTVFIDDEINVHTFGGTPGISGHCARVNDRNNPCACVPNAPQRPVFISTSPE
jgi:hypothetical protein